MKHLTLMLCLFLFACTNPYDDVLPPGFSSIDPTNKSQIRETVEANEKFSRSLRLIKPEERETVLRYIHDHKTIPFGTTISKAIAEQKAFEVEHKPEENKQ